MFVQQLGKWALKNNIKIRILQFSKKDVFILKCPLSYHILHYGTGHLKKLKNSNFLPVSSAEAVL